MVNRLVAKPIDQLRTVADAVSRGNLAVDLSRAGARRADELVACFVNSIRWCVNSG